MKDLNKITDKGWILDRYYSEYDILDNFTHKERVRQMWNPVLQGATMRSSRKLEAPLVEAK